MKILILALTLTLSTTTAFAQATDCMIAVYDCGLNTKQLQRFTHKIIEAKGYSVVQANENPSFEIAVNCV
jgi:hypothetical protein